VTVPFSFPSTSLVPGTLVSVHFQFATGTNLDSFNDSGGSGAHVRRNPGPDDA
jgi:hypothetical protein